jgi:hypothetical protein
MAVCIPSPVVEEASVDKRHHALAAAMQALRLMLAVPRP